jgi:hypothetical protein
MTTAEPPTQAVPSRSKAKVGALLALVAIGAGVAVLLGLYGSLHTGTGQGVNLAGFTNNKYAKAWLTTIAFVLALVQITTALIIFGKIKVANPPSWIGGLHRWSGRIAVLVTVPVAVDCLYAFGFEATNTRVLVHSLLGCIFYGAFVTKMLVLSRKGLPGWALPVIGGVVFSALVGLWLTAGLWLFTTQGVKI